MTLATNICYGLAVAFFGPFRKLGSRTPAITRFDSNKQYFAERVAETSDYRKLFAPHVSFEDKTVLDLGCNRGYLLHSFRKMKGFTVLGDAQGFITWKQSGGV